MRSGDTTLAVRARMAEELAEALRGLLKLAGDNLEAANKALPEFQHAKRTLQRWEVIR